jgi:phosphoribosylamine--glycine ligase
LKILIVGSGGREHALAWRLLRSPSVSEVIVSPGNAGIAQLARCIPAPPDISGYADLVLAERVDLTVVGPEAPLVAGVVDHFRARGLKIIGPTQAAARLEGSKVFAKQFFERARIPTARSVQVSSAEEGIACLKDFGLPVVIKADGLAAGKGVIIAQTQEEAKDAIHKLGPSLVVEEFLEGEEVSFIGLSTGSAVLPFPPSQDHKRAFDGDAGPNTGGMGSYVDNRVLTVAQSGTVMDRVMLPAIRQMTAEGTPFTGFLYAGLMMTSHGPKVLEFNVRLGDPETQALMYSFEGDLAQFLLGDATAARPAATLKPAVCVVLAAAGYPDSPRTGDIIYGIDDAEGAGTTVFHAGTKMKEGAITVSGGRVLGVTASGDTLPSAIAAAYRGVEKIHFEGMHYRRDIGRKGLLRW